jgi:hypothetical protein
MDYKIENYITRNYYELLKVCKKYTKNDDWASELLHDIFLQLYERDNIKLKNLDDNSIKGYIIRTITINWCYPSSPFYKKYKKVEQNNVELTQSMEMFMTDTNTDEHEIIEIIETEWAELDWFNKIIFEKYMVLGSLKKVSQDTTIPISSISDYVRNTRNLIKTNTINKFNRDE